MEFKTKHGIYKSFGLQLKQSFSGMPVMDNCNC